MVAQFCQTNDEFAAAVLNQPFVIDNHYPCHPLFKTCLQLLPRNIVTDCLLDALTVFTDASRKSKRAGFVWQLHGYWYSHSPVVEGSAQILELLAVLEVLKRWPQQPLNIVIDSLYVVDIAQRLHFAFIGKIQNPLLFSAITQLRHILQQQHHRKEPGPILLTPTLQIFVSIYKVPSQLSLLQAEQAQLPQPLLVREVFQSPHHPCSLPLDSLQ